MEIEIANIVTAFKKETIGTKVLDYDKFYQNLRKAINDFDWTQCKTPGQAVVDLVPYSNGDLSYVSGGIGKKTVNPYNYVIRSYREGPHMFLKREFAEPPTSLKVVLYTKEAYLNDPDVINDKKEWDLFNALGCKYVIVAILASVVDSYVSPYRFVANLAGGNRDYEEGKMTYKQLVELAKRVKQFSDSWITVAD